MAINVQLPPGAPGEVVAPAQPVNRKLMEIELNVRRTVDGDVMVFDHADVDIVIMPKISKIVSMPKDMMSEIVYGASDRLFKFLTNKGLVARDSIQGGNIYGSLEATFLLPFNLKLVLLNISKFIDEERPYFEFVEKFEETSDQYFIDPSDEDSTKLGEVPHEVSKGTLQPGFNYGPYFANYVLENIKRDK